MIRIETSPFGETDDGLPCTLYTLENEHGTQAKISDFGATMVEFVCADKHGVFSNILLRQKNALNYQQQGGFLGALVGPYANRIGGARLFIDGVEHPLEANQGDNTLHGGSACFAYKMWRCERCDVIGGIPTLDLRLAFANGEAGYPGNIEVKLHIQLFKDSALKVIMTAESDRKTAVSLTQHPYFNLAGEQQGKKDLLNQHKFEIHSQDILAVDEHLVPTGDVKSVAGSCFDFSKPKGVMEFLEPLVDELALACGYDHNYCFDRQASEENTPQLQGVVTEATSGRRLEVYSTLPGLQFYTGNHLLEAGFERFQGFCLEPQYYPDSPNKAHFPFQWTEPGKPFSHTIEWRVGVED